MGCFFMKSFSAARQKPRAEIESPMDFQISNGAHWVLGFKIGKELLYMIVDELEYGAPFPKIFV